LNHQPIEEMECYRIFEEVADWGWTQVEKWKPYARHVIGEQLVAALDSVNANLVEGDGRYALKDSINFFVIARASAREGRLWIKRAIKRELVGDLDGQTQISKLEQATRLLNALITYRRSARFAVKESRSAYVADSENTDPFASIEAQI
jgi:four helix bundle protein